MVLLIDPVGEIARIGLAENGTVVAKDPFVAGGALAENLAGRIAQMLTARGATFADLTRIRVHCGPGKFSAVRIGVVTANVLGCALGIPVAGVSGAIATLAELLAAKADADVPVLPIYDRPPQVTFPTV